MEDGWVGGMLMVGVLSVDYGADLGFYGLCVVEG